MKNSLTLFVFLFCYVSLIGQNDSIISLNNNVLVGEVKNLNKSILTLKTPYSDSDFKVKWINIMELYSDELFIIQLTNGNRINGTINTSPDDKSIVLINTEGYIIETTLNDIIFLDAIGKNFFSRLKAEFDLGFSLTKSNNSKQFSSNAILGYVSDKWSLNTSFSAVVGSQDLLEDTKRIETDIAFNWFLANDWFLSTSANFLTNNELKIQLRTTGMIGGGYYFKRTNSLHFGTGAGLAYNNETYTGPEIEDKQSIEAYFGGEFNKYAIGDLSLLTSFFGYPSITEDNRFRFDYKFEMKYDLPLDFYVKMSLVYNYDNQPAEGAPEGDYVFQTSFGWELK